MKRFRFKRTRNSFFGDRTTTKNTPISMLSTLLSQLSKVLKAVHVSCCIGGTWRYFRHRIRNHCTCEASFKNRKLFWNFTMNTCRKVAPTAVKNFDRSQSASFGAKSPLQTLLRGHSVFLYLLLAFLELLLLPSSHFFLNLCITAMLMWFPCLWFIVREHG